MNSVILFCLLCAGAPLVFSAPAPPQNIDYYNLPIPSWEPEWNKRVVRSFYQEVFGDKNIEAADKYVNANQYIQHSPGLPDGLEPMKAQMRIWFNGHPKENIDFQHIGAEGDLVFTHTRKVGGISKKISSVMDIFKLRDGKIIEHWDVEQDLPATAANPHPMF